MSEMEEGTMVRLNGRVYEYIGRGEDAAGTIVAHLRPEDAQDVEQFPR